MIEQWVPLKGYESLYEISNTGKIKSLKKNKIRKPSINEWGYEVVSLSKSGEKLKTVFAHRLVALVFIPNPYNKPEVNHKDGNKLNNNVDNLEWCTRSENAQHAWDNKLITREGEKHHKHKLTDELVLLCKDLRRLLISYRQISQVMYEVFNINVAECTISLAVYGKSWTHLKNDQDENFKQYTSKGRISRGWKNRV